MSQLTCSNDVVESTIELRSRRLAAGLITLGVKEGDELAVICCDDHAVDQAVAESAAELLACPMSVLSEKTDRDLKHILKELRPTFLLACPHGTARWQESGVPCRVIGDEGAIVWWKLLELRAVRNESQDDGLTLRLASHQAGTLFLADHAVDF